MLLKTSPRLNCKARSTFSLAKSPSKDPNKSAMDVGRNFLAGSPDIINAINNMRSDEVKEEPNDIIEFTL